VQHNAARQGQIAYGPYSGARSSARRCTAHAAA